MSHRARRGILAAVVVVCTASSSLDAAEVVTHPYPGITHIKRTDVVAGSTRQVKMNIVLVDLNAPEVRFKMKPQGQNLPAPLFGSPGWPLPYPPFETVRRSTLGFLEDAHAQVAIDGHFFAPFPVPAGSNQGAYAYLIGLAASRGNVYSAFERPFQIYAIVPDAPGLNVDRDNNASIVHRDPAFPDGKHVLENVTLWNALAGSGQIITNGVKTIPCYVDAANPSCPLIGPGNGNYSNNNSWYNLINARAAIGLTQDNRTLVLFTVDIRPNAPNPERSQGMRVGEVADVLRNDYGVWNALNLDGGGSTTMAMQDPVDHVRRVINVPSDNPPRQDGSSFAVYSDGIEPVTTATASPAANANGWNNTDVTVSLAATDLRNGITSNPAGWVDEIQHALAGAQPSPWQVTPGSATSVGITAEGMTTVAYFATDAADNDEGENELTVRIDRTRPDVAGMPATDCSLWPPNHQMGLVAVVSASDALSGVADGGLAVTAASSAPSDPEDTLVVPDGAGGFAVYLRAERRGNSPGGRVYTITATATDRAFNTRTVSATCVVPHDRGGH